MTQHPSITCPRCGRTSYNSNDIREGYCGACHDWTNVPTPPYHGPLLAVRPLDGFERGTLEQAIPKLRAEYRHPFADVLQAILNRFTTATTVPDATDVDAAATVTLSENLLPYVRPEIRDSIRVLRAGEGVLPPEQVQASADAARIKTAKRQLRAWAEPALARMRGVAIGANPDTLAPQHALWLLEYIEQLEARIAAAPESTS